MSELKEEIEALLCRVDELDDAKSAVEVAIDAIENAVAYLPHDIQSPHSGSMEWEEVLAEIEVALQEIKDATEDLV